MSSIKTLLVEDDEKMRQMLSTLLTQRGHAVTACTSGEEAWSEFEQSAFPLVVLDWTLPGEIDGLQLCQKIRAAPNGDLVLILLVTGRNRPEDLNAVLGAGADDYVVKPVSMSVLNVRLAIAERRVRDLATIFEAKQKIGFLEEQVKSRTAFEGMIGKSAAMQESFRRIRLAAQSDVPVLILGESGTGKDLAAGAIHSLSGRRDKSFLAINCSAIPETLLESELFGHVKGAFTGASGDHMGIFQAAHGGTLFLDEIGDLTPNLQVKLLRTLEKNEVRRVGDTKTLNINVRLISATNRDLKRLLVTGGMREDFYYRIQVFEITLPPLRDRPEDIPLLADHFLGEFSRSQQKSIRHIDRDAMLKLVSHPWPGNIRQLRNAIEHACVTADGDSLTILHLSEDVRHPKMAPPKPLAESTGIEQDKHLLQEALRQAGGKRVAAAKALRISRVTLWKKMRLLGIQ